MRVSVDSELSEFEVEVGIYQGCMLSLYLFCSSGRCGDWIGKRGCVS